MYSELSVDDVKVFLFDHIKRQIITDIKPLLKEKNDKEDIGGYFAVPLLIFTLIEYLGRLRFGYTKEKNKGRWGGSSCAVWWIKRYLRPANIRYQKLGALLYNMLRHGVVHRRQPNSYLFSLKKGFGWELVKAEKQNEHLQIKKGKWLVVSLDSLVQDLEAGIDLFWSDLKSSRFLRKKFSKAYWKLRKPLWVPYLIGKGGKKYLRKDFLFIKEELRPLF